MDFVLLLQAAQNRNSVFDGRLADEHRLETPRERRILLDIFAVFVQRGRADTMQLAARQGGFQQVRRIHRAFRRTGADQRVQFVDKENDLAACTGDLGQHGLQALLELAAEFGPCDKRAHVERHQPLVAQAFGHVAIDDPQRQAFRNRRLAHAGLADEHGIVLGAARENLNRAADFLVAANDGIELAGTCGFGEIAGIFLQRIIGVFRRGAVGRAALAQIGNRLVEILRGDAGILQDARHVGARRHGQREQQIFGGDEAVAGLGCNLLGVVEQTRGFRREVNLPVAAFDARHFRQCDIVLRAHLRRIAARGRDKPRSQAFLVVQQHLQKVLRQELLIVGTQSERLRGLNEALRALREFLNVHSVLSSPKALPLRASNHSPMKLEYRPGWARFLDTNLGSRSVLFKGLKSRSWAFTPATGRPSKARTPRRRRFHGWQ